MIIQKKISKSPWVAFIFSDVLNNLYNYENGQDLKFFLKDLDIRFIQHDYLCV